MTDTDTVSFCETKGKQEDGEDESEDGCWKALQSVDVLLDCMAQRGFEWSDTAVTRQLCTAVTRSECKQFIKVGTILNIISK
jgi:hypothetical protein